MIIGLGLPLAPKNVSGLGTEPASLFLNHSFAGTKSLGPFSFARASEQRYIDENGVLQIAANNVPALTHDRLTQQSLGILLEGARTNHLLHSRDLTNIAWVKTNVAAAKDAVGLDFVSNSASSLTANAAAGTALQTITLTSLSRTFSVYVKRRTGMGTVEITDNNGTNWTNITSQINSSTFTRVEINRTQANPVVGFRLGNIDDAIEIDFCQIEDGTFSSSPILTTTVAATRARTECTAHGLSTSFGAAQGTVMMKGRHNIRGAIAVSHYLLQVDDNTVSDRILIRLGSSTAIFAQSFHETLDDGSVSRAAPSPGVNFGIVFTYANNDFAASMNGASDFTGSPDTTAAFPLNNPFAQFWLGARDSFIDPAFCTIAEIRAYNARLTDAERNALSVFS